MSDSEEEIVIKKKVKISIKEVNIENKKDKNYDELIVENNGIISYIIKKYKHKSIISIYEAKYNSHNFLPEKGRLILVKWYKKFYEVNGAYLLQLKGDKCDPYEYMFIGGTLIYEFDLLKEDSFVKFNCVLGNSSQIYLEGKNNTYILSSDLIAVENSLLDFKEIQIQENRTVPKCQQHKKFRYKIRTNDILNHFESFFI